jgi:hypothetical protein
MSPVVSEILSSEAQPLETWEHVPGTFAGLFALSPEHQERTGGKYAIFNLRNEQVNHYSIY